MYPDLCARKERRQRRIASSMGAQFLQHDEYQILF